MIEPQDARAERRLIDGVARGKRRWLIARFPCGFAVMRPGRGGCIVFELPPEFQFSAANRAMLIWQARSARIELAALCYGVGNA